MHKKAVITPPTPPSSITLDDWSHVRETINMLYLAICQIEATLSDSNASVETLTHSFTALAEHNHAMNANIQAVNEPQDLEAFKKTIADTTDKMNVNIKKSVQAFQFYDRVCQRLDHVSSSLKTVSGIMSNNDSLHIPAEWRRIQNTIKNSYTMEAEHAMFEHIMQGGSIEEALDIYQQHFNQYTSHPRNDADNIELF
ncbi:hypothetical protein [Marinagarivorans algicola]|uniref:hypothetical protein n=1 Tax=Marinagarivorans algicola TaxID=1513270 RepID=UPI0006BA0618|nr:hypothetical protein [Marinagarivorans algicola]